MATRRTLLVGSLLFAGAVAVGCSSGVEPIDLPQVKPQSAADAIVAAADKDGDDRLSVQEIRQLLPVNDAAATIDIDTDSDGLVTTKELGEHIEKHWQPGTLKLISFATRITLDGRPLGGAELEFVPVEALAGQLSTARGTSDKRGMVVPTIASESLSGGQTAPRGQMQPGFYRVRVTHPTRSIPARYQQSALSIEVVPSASMETPTLKLRSG